MLKRILERRSRLIGVVGSGLLIAGLAHGGQLGLTLVFAGLAVLALVSYSPGDGLLLLGPFARWELIRTAKRGWMFWYRVVIGGLALWLIGTNFIFFENWFGTSNVPPTTAMMAQAANTSFITLLGMLGCMAVAFSVFQLPTIITEEKEAKRIEHVLVTDLRNREIIIGKLAGRFAVLAMYVACVFPILALLMLFGGVDPVLLLTSAIMLIFGFLGVGGIAAGVSAIVARSTGAVALAAILLVAHQIGCSHASEFGLPANAWPVVRFLESGNLFIAIEGISSTTNDATEISRLLRHFGANQLALASIGWLLAVTFIRRDGKRDGGTVGRTLKGFSRSPVERGPMQDQPILWLETTAPVSVATRWANRWVLRLWWLPAVLIAGLTVYGSLDAASRTTSATSINFAISGFYAWWLLCIPAAWNTSRGVVRERQFDTLDALLMTGLEPRDILSQKWQAAIWCGRARWGVALAFWLTALLFEAASFLGVVLVIVSSITTTAMMASLGILSSVYSKSMQSAFGKILLGWFGWLFCMYLLACCGGSILATAFAGVGLGRSGIGWFGLPLAIVGAISPPAAMSTAPSVTLIGNASGEMTAVTCVLLGILVSSIVSRGAYRMALERFERQVRPRPRQRESRNRDDRDR